ncbi:MAG: DUF2007 domain-containing protein [Candidatus Levyibacteriota bacterium]
MAKNDIPMGDLETVHIFQNKVQAELAKGLLETHGIKSVIFADDNGGMDPFPMQPSYGVFLKVIERDLEKAKALLDQANK